jgi:tRNA pseudouridine55 synthase
VNSKLHGAILVNKHQGTSSFGVLDALKKILKKQGLEFPKLGHGGTLDPFATGLLIVCIGRGVKLSRYFLGSTKKYEATLRFGETTVPGDPTDPISETSSVLPHSLDQLNTAAKEFESTEYQQIPPMHSAKKKNGKPLYELARQGIEIERDPKLCKLTDFKFLSYDSPRARFSVGCSSGTYIRTLAQDFAKKLGTVGMLDTLHRTGSGIFDVESSVSVSDLATAAEKGMPWGELPAFVPLDRLLDGYPRAEASAEEAQALLQGKQQFLQGILARVTHPSDTSPRFKDRHENHVAVYFENRLLAVAVREQEIWGLERVFLSEL